MTNTPIHIEEKELIKVINETVKEEIRKIEEYSDTKREVWDKLNEAYGISDRVVSKTGEICGWVENMMKGSKGKLIDGYGTTLYEGDMIIDCFGTKAKIKYSAKNYASNEAYDRLSPKEFDGETNGNEKTIRLSLATVNKRVTKESLDTIQHELHHFLEIAMSNDGKVIGNKRYRNFYDKAINNIKELKKRKFSEENDTIRYLLNMVVYYSLDSEARAYTNSLDSYIRRSGDIHNCNDVIRNSEVYGILKEIKIVLKLWDYHCFHKIYSFLLKSEQTASTF